MILGSGTSVGVPFIGCDCAVCTSTNPRNKRLRCSLLVRDGDRRILVDCGPDFRQQALAHDLRRLDAVVLTHAHADHVLGLDDLRLLIIRSRLPMPIHGEPEVLDAVRRVYAYAFAEHDTGSFLPRFELHALDPQRPLELAGLQFQPIPVEHAATSTIGLRLGDLAYLPDCKRIPPESVARLQGLDTLVLDGLRPRPHRTHLNLEEALAVIADLRPRQAFLTHLTHDVDHDLLERELPAGVQLAYDGLVLPVTGYDAAT